MVEMEMALTDCFACTQFVINAHKLQDSSQGEI